MGGTAVVDIAVVAVKLCDIKIVTEVNEARRMLLLMLGPLKSIVYRHFQQLFSRSMLRMAFLNYNHG